MNPTKCDIGKISKIILDRVNHDLSTLTRYNQWESSKTVIDWFNDIPDKNKCSFLIFNIQELYPSISEELLRNAIQFASENMNINETEKNAIFHCRKSLLYHNKEPWIKNHGNKEFDVTWVVMMELRSVK